MVSCARATATRHAGLDDILDGIQSGRWRADIEEVRLIFATQGKEAADERKKDLPAFTPSGTFSRRCTEGLIDPSGVICLDFDALGDRLCEIRPRIDSDPHTLASFLSPKGDGLKVCVRVPADSAQHAAAWKAAAAYYTEVCDAHPDPNRKDIAGLCFVSFDPDLYINKSAQPFDPEREQERKSVSLEGFLSSEPVVPLLVRSLIRNGVAQSGGPHGGRNASAFWIACQLRDAGHDHAHTKHLVLEFAGHCQPPLDESAAVATVISAFKRPPREPAKLPESGPTSPAGEHPSGASAVVHQDLSPAAPESWWNEDLIAQYGKPYFEHKTEKGVKFDGINEVYWAALHAAHFVELLEPAEKNFYRYENSTGLFREISADLIKAEIAAMLLRAGTQGNPMLIQERTDGKLKAVAALLRGLIEYRDAFAKGDRRFIHLANGVLQIADDGTLDLNPFSPDYRSRNQSPIAYNPDARCERFMNELLLPAVRPDDALVVQKYAGLCLLGHNLIQRFLILDGEAGRGKTQLALVLQFLVGLSNCTQLRTAHLGERFETYRFLKRTLLVGVDVPADFLNTPGASVIKGLVGGDLFDAEQKGGTGSFQIAGNFNILITSNSRLRVRLEGDVGAWRRRLLIVRYEAPPPKKKIPDFGKHLIAEEGSGILNWALDGLRALLQDVTETGDIRLTPAQTSIVDALLAESDSLRHFLKQNVERRSGSDLTVNEIIESYAEFCPAQGWTPLPITIVQRQLEALMLELFGTVKVNDIRRNDRNQRGFRSVSWNGDATEQQPPPQTEIPPELW